MGAGGKQVYLGENPGGKSKAPVEAALESGGGNGAPVAGDLGSGMG